MRPSTAPSSPAAPAPHEPIYLISPSGAVADIARARHAASILKQLGHPTCFDPAALRRTQRFAGSDDQRAGAFA
ncbi:MAG: hypothetical protein WCN85_15515, partial [Burkholderiales bacterium]